AINAALGPSLVNAVLATGLVWWPQFARLVRGQALRLRNEDFVEAARAVGASPSRILLRHILPNTWTPIVVAASLSVGYAVLTMSALSFVGLGAQPPTPEWGSMVSIGHDFFLTEWWLVTFPGFAIFITV